jgi:hypothetical protein
MGIYDRQVSPARVIAPYALPMKRAERTCVATVQQAWSAGKIAAAAAFSVIWRGDGVGPASGRVYREMKSTAGYFLELARRND